MKWHSPLPRLSFSRVRDDSNLYLGFLLTFCHWLSGAPAFYLHLGPYTFCAYLTWPERSTP